MSIVIEALGFVLSIFAFLVSLASVVVAYFRGDMAAQKASEKLQRQREQRERLAALQSLVNETERIQKAIEHNARLDVTNNLQPILRLPVNAFETAFVSGRPGLDASDKLIQAVSDYLCRADCVNSLVDVYPSSIAGLGTGTIAPKNIAEQVVRHCEDREDKGSPSALAEQLRTRLQEEIRQTEIALEQ